jgi:uncharacterized alkaline shock family protein YloU
MNHSSKKTEIKKIDTKEFELPETHFVRDIENKVFQGIVLQALSKIPGIAPIEGNFIDNIFGRGVTEGTKGITIEQDNKNHSVGVKIEVNICYGFSIPEKAEAIQMVCSEEITKLTGLHVAYVHVVFKNITWTDQQRKHFLPESQRTAEQPLDARIGDEYSDEF